MATSEMNERYKILNNYYQLLATPISPFWDEPEPYTVFQVWDLSQTFRRYRWHFHCVQLHCPRPVAIVNCYFVS